MHRPMCADRVELAESFEQAASLYEVARPSYPDALFDDLVELTGLTPGDRLLEIGCATGKATRPMLERGFSVVCLEAGEKLAVRARQNLAGLPVQVHVARFEEWSEKPQRFDLVYAATAWHWPSPQVRYQKAHRLLRPGGHLAFWSALHAFPQGFDPFFTEIQEVYDAIGEHWQGDWPPPPPEEIPDDRSEIESSGLFELLAVRRYVWESTYSAEQYIALLDTFSGHITMQPNRRAHLYREIRKRIGARKSGQIQRHWYAILHVARRAGNGSVP
jgi:SAM-dependent methyltransferase